MAFLLLIFLISLWETVAPLKYFFTVLYVFFKITLRKKMITKTVQTLN